MLAYLVFLLVFTAGELAVNRFWFRYLKYKFITPRLTFSIEEEAVENKPVRMLGLDLSTFKGVMERFIMSVCLLINLPTILVVFGALKIGTRLKDADDKVKSDYFLIGNLSSIIISVAYVFLFNGAVFVL